MSAGKHTPGPWSLEDGNPLTVVHDDGDDFPWFITTVHVGFAPGEAEANARLIAAAPDMLAALKEATARLHLAMVTSGTDFEFADLGVAKYRAAIAKAEGSSDA